MKKDWDKHYKQLWFREDAVDTHLTVENVKGFDEIDMKGLKQVLQPTKNRKSRGLDGWSLEMCMMVSCRTYDYYTYLICVGKIHGIDELIIQITKTAKE